MPNAAKRDFIYELDHMAPAARHALLGEVLDSHAKQINAVVSDHAALLAKYALLLAHIDTGNVAGLGTANAATYAPAAQVSVAVLPLGG